jgi:Cdc6-like AAA superfamily ATPase
MASTNLNLKEQAETNSLTQDATHALHILDEVENFTAALRKKIMTELKQANSNSVHLKLDDMQ